jgi:hypothetical protein
MIEGNVKAIMENLRPMKEVKDEIIAEREAKAAAGVKKSLVILGNRLYLKVS